jgi:hypothetical protein
MDLELLLESVVKNWKTKEYIIPEPSAAQNQQFIY